MGQRDLRGKPDGEIMRRQSQNMGNVGKRGRQDIGRKVDNVNATDLEIITRRRAFLDTAQTV
ncbi:hypothetical protein ColKHC_11556 [Colletotrichum higginsianum]|nr:hypothetical protein ColKHC_11556 [Colletotrichum higginsianum]